MLSDFAKAVIYKVAVDVPVLLILSWLWFGHPGHNLWFVGASTGAGIILLYLFEQYWAIQDRWRHALPIAVVWSLLVTSMFVFLFFQN